ncbi:MAG: DNA polymerase III subunit delta [Rickettsiales bacterium]|nr:DNA polymerase III subunit delta [Rickettsiales bacterium]
MKLNAAQTNQFIAKPDPNVQFALIYGTDEGVIKERCHKLRDQIADSELDPFSVTEFSFDALKEDSALLADEMASISMYGGRKCIIVRDVPQSVPPAIKDLVKKPLGDAFVIFLARELTPRSSFRKLFETDKHVVCIACYPLEQYNLTKTIRDTFDEAGFRYDAHAIKMLEQLFSGSNLLLIRNELTKIMLYKDDERFITSDDIITCCSNDLEASLDSLSDAIASRNPKTATKIYDSLINENKYPAPSIIRYVNNYFNRIYIVRHKVDQGIPIDQAMSALRPPIFYKSKPSFIKNVRNWNTKRTMNLIKKLQKAETECKRTAAPVRVICNQLFTILSA